MGFADVMGYYLGMTPVGIEIPNKGWESGDAGGWLLQSTLYASCAVGTGDPRSGLYDLELIANLAHVSIAWATYSHPNFRAYAGKTIEFSIHNKRIPGKGSGTAYYIRIADGVSNTDQTFVGGSGQYNKTTVQHTVAANPGTLNFIIWAQKGSSGTFGWYIDDMDAKVV